MGGFTIDGCGATDRFYAIKELGVFTCPYCHKEVRFTLDEVKRKVDIFFIPTATLSTKYAIMCKNCERGDYISEDDKISLMNGSKVVDIDKNGIVVRERSPHSDSKSLSSDNSNCKAENFAGQDVPEQGPACPMCKTILQDNALFCWNCGYSLKGKTDKAVTFEHGEGNDRTSNSGTDFLMPIEDVFTISGRGTVVTGRIEQGSIHVGDAVEIVDSSNKKINTFVDGIEMFRKLITSANENDNVGLLLRSVARHEVKRGYIVCKQRSSDAQEKFSEDECFSTVSEASTDNFDDISVKNQDVETCVEASAMELPVPSTEKAENDLPQSFSFLPERKVCPKCNMLYIGSKEKCTICGCDLVVKKDGRNE